MSNKEVFNKILKNKISDLNHELITRISEYTILNKLDDLNDTELFNKANSFFNNLLSKALNDNLKKEL